MRFRFKLIKKLQKNVGIFPSVHVSRVRPEYLHVSRVCEKDLKFGLGQLMNTFCVDLKFSNTSVR